MNALSAFTVEHFFAGSLIGGLAISLVLFLSVARLPLRLRMPRKLRIRPRMRVKDSEHLPSFLPATVGISITCFGLFGLILRVLLHTSVILAIAGAIVLSVLLFSWLVAATRKLLANTGRPMEGTALIGSVAHVCLSIPNHGVGAIAYVSEGKRHTMPARCTTPLELGSRVVILDLQKRVAVVEELDFWASSMESS